MKHRGGIAVLGAGSDSGVIHGWLQTGVIVAAIFGAVGIEIFWLKGRH